jgi:uncharacterized protein (DUF1800 family)
MSSLRRIAAMIRATTWRVALWPVRVAAARAMLAQLCAMDARELADIGLAPHDLRDVTAAPLDADPSTLFAARAAERKTRAVEQRRAVRAEPQRQRPARVRSHAT